MTTDFPMLSYDTNSASSCSPTPSGSIDSACRESCRPQGPGPQAVELSFHAVTEADRQHLSQTYWRWCELFDRDPASRPSQHPDLLFAELSDAVLCSASHAGQVLALGILAPKVMSLRRAGGFGFKTSLHGFRLVGNRLLGTADEALTRRMLAACATYAREHHATFLLIEDLERHDPHFVSAESLQQDGFRLFSPTGIQERLKIEFPPTPTDYWTKFSSKTRNTFKRKQKKIGTTRLVRIFDPTQVAEFLEVAHTISKRTWQSEKLGLRIHNNDAELRFFTVLATQQWLRSYLLFVDDKPAAFLIGTQHNGIFSYEEVGYDREFSDRSPGQVLLLQVLEDLLSDHPPRVFDFGGGTADYKQLFATNTSASGTLWVVPPGVRPQLCLAYLRGCRLLDRTARAVAKKLGATTLLRQLIRGKLATSSVVASNVDSAEAGHVENVPHEGGGAV